MTANGITFIQKDQLWNDEQTNYWFSVNDEEYAIADQNGDLKLLDADGVPVEPCNDHDRVFDQLVPLVENHIED